VSRSRKPSNQALSLLNALLSRPQEWRYGYELTKEIGLKSGTLYPLLMRLTDEGLLESEWHPPARPNLPPRHGYRLTARGIAFARDVTAEAQQPAVRHRLAPA
jgi:DNA-binding PadR family transcriptional regulator